MVNNMTYMRSLSFRSLRRSDVSFSEDEAIPARRVEERKLIRHRSYRSFCDQESSDPISGSLDGAQNGKCNRKLDPYSHEGRSGNKEKSHSNKRRRGKKPSSSSGKKPSSSFRKLAQSRKFEKITEALLNSCDDQELADWLDETCCPLHDLLVFQPPLDLVTLMIEKLVELENKFKSSDFGGPGIHPIDTIDEDGQLPLHVAAANGCDVAVVELLMKGSSAVLPATVRDFNQRTPLHAACTNPKGIATGRGIWGSKIVISKSKKGIANMEQVVKVLLHAHPQAVMVRDKDIKRPVDLARKHKAEQSVIGMLVDKARSYRNESLKSMTQHSKNSKNTKECSLGKNSKHQSSAKGSSRHESSKVDDTNRPYFESDGLMELFADCDKPVPKEVLCISKNNDSVSSIECDVGRI